MAVFPSKVNYATGDILTATNMNDIGGAINALDGSQWAAGKNKVINGDFGIWQRGTSISIPNTAVFTYTADRWGAWRDGSGTVTVTQQTFTPATAPVAGYEGQYFLRYNHSVAGTGQTFASIESRLEDVRLFAGQTITISFWAKADAGTTISNGFYQNFGSGGSGSVYSTYVTNVLTTSWQRFTQTVAVPSISGKTIGTSSYFAVGINPGLNAAKVIDIWGFQVEASQTATPFQTATGTKQGELAACQRYYVRFTGGTNYSPIGLGYGESATNVAYSVMLPVTPRTNITTIDYANVANSDGATTTAVTSLTVLNGGTQNVSLRGSQASGITQYRPYGLINNGNTAGYVGFSAEL